MRRRPLNAAELEVLSAVLREVGADHKLPVYRRTESDGPNTRGLTQWYIPESLTALGEVVVAEDETQDNIRFRRPILNGELAEVTLEMPHQLCHYRLEMTHSGWRLL